MQAWVNIPWALLVWAGFSCKDLSTLNVCPELNLFESGEGSTGVTWKGLCAYGKRHRPAISVYENVRGLVLIKNLQPMLVQALATGYWCMWHLVIGMDYGLPQYRLGSGCFSCASIWLPGFRSTSSN